MILFNDRISCWSCTTNFSQEDNFSSLADIESWKSLIFNSNFSFCVVIISKFSSSSPHISASISISFLSSFSVLYDLFNKCSLISASWSNRSLVFLAFFRFSKSSILLFQLLRFLQSKGKLRTRKISKTDMHNSQSNRLIIKGWRVSLGQYPLAPMFLYFTVWHKSRKSFSQNNCSHIVITER